MIKKIISMTRHLLEEYSPLALAVLVIPFFLPVEPQLHRRLLLIFCALPGLLLTLLNPKAVFKNPVLLLMMLFVAYFSAQDIRGLLPLTAGTLRWQIVRAAIIIFPAVLLSQATPRRKLYTPALRSILAVIAGAVLFSLFSFYAEMPFPLARFQLSNGSLTHISLSAMGCGFAAILAGALLLQGTTRLALRNMVELMLLPVFLGAMLYTHSRATALAFFAVMAAAALPVLKQQRKRTLCVYAIAAATVTGYFGTVVLLPGREINQTSPITGAVSQDQTASVPFIQQRPGGIAASGETGMFSVRHRLNMWNEHLGRLKESRQWLTGFGLGMNNFVQDVPPEKQYLYYIGDHGWEIHTHSGYVWALYFGGLIGLGLLVLLLAAALIRSFRAGQSGYAGFALTLFGAVVLLVDMKSLLTGQSSISYLLFWIPLGLAAAQKQSVTSGS